jgi:hypothetical protein
MAPLESRAAFWMGLPTRTLAKRATAIATRKVEMKTTRDANP